MKNKIDDFSKLSEIWYAVSSIDSSDASKASNEKAGGLCSRLLSSGGPHTESLEQAITE